MSKLNQIQKQLLQLDGGAFQKLADAYLRRKGYEQINAVGSLVGKNKVRQGTPDTFVPLPNKKYVFAEYTTQQEGLYEKLHGDLSKCLDAIKTGLPIDRIEEVVFCHTSVLDVEEVDKLTDECQRHGVNLNIFGVTSIAFDLYQKYPGLAKDFLGVEVDTGQIVTPGEFINTYGKNKLSTRLDTTFHFRETELTQILQSLETDNLVIVAGKAGVGKSRLVLECCARYVTSHPAYEVRCIFNRGPDLFEDLRVYFADSGHFLIFVDDANRISRFEYIIQLIQQQRSDQQIKVIVTVRDYALDKIKEAARLVAGDEIILSSFDDDQIKQLIRDEYQILNHVYLDRIASIAKGNPRLAVMAAEIAKRENTFQSIANVAHLYDEYFASIRQDIEQLNDRNLLKVAGIIAFFQYVDRSNKELMDAIKTAFGISPEQFWETAHSLHQLEILDMYENEVVRTADQVLATYLFYVAFFKERTLNLSAILQHFFPQFQYRLVDSINPILSVFDTQIVIESMRPHVDRAWKAAITQEDHNYLLHLIEVFWFLKQTDTLLYLQEIIEEAEQVEVDIAKLDFKPKPDIPHPSMLSVLAIFSHSDPNICRMALELLLSYLAKQPDKLAEGLHLLVDSFSFHHRSHFQAFYVQQTVIDVVWEADQNTSSLFFAKLFLAVSEKYLQVHFHTSEAKGNHAVTLIDFELPPVPEIFRLRQKIWNGLFELFRTGRVEKEVVSIIDKYCRFPYFATSKEIVSEDAKALLPFIRTSLQPDNYRHCVVVNKYIDMLEVQELPVDVELRTIFFTEQYQIYHLLVSDSYERRFIQFDYHEYEKFKKEQIKQFFNDKDFNYYEKFLNTCCLIQQHLDEDHELYKFRNGVIAVLVNLASNAHQLYSDVFSSYLALDDPLKLAPYAYPLVNQLITTEGVEKAHRILSDTDSSTKRHWQIIFHQCLPNEAVTIEYQRELYSLYEESTVQELPHHLDFLLKYHAFDKYVISQIIQIVLKKTEKDPNYLYRLEMLYNPHTEINKIIVEISKDNLSLFKKAYLAITQVAHAIDYDLHTLLQIVNLDDSFLQEYIDCLYSEAPTSTRRDRHHDYTKLWLHDDYKKLVTQVIDRIYEYEQKSNVYGRANIEDFFEVRKGDSPNKEVIDRQQYLLTELIVNRHSDSSFMEFIFNVIRDFAPERRLALLAIFLQNNQSFEIFRGLSLEPLGWSWSGSAVPTLQGRIEYFESLLPLVNTVKLLKHKQLIEQEIQRLRNQIEYEKKRDFMRD
jgi:hypothetical protein